MVHHLDALMRMHPGDCLMEKMFAALRERHPGYEVSDVRFSVSPSLSPQAVDAGVDTDSLDEQFARVVRSAKDVSMETFNDSRDPYTPGLPT